MSRPAGRILLSAGLLLAGVAGLLFFLLTGSRPEQGSERQAGVLVETSPVESVQRSRPIRVHGTVRPARRLVLRSQVGGEVVELAPDLEVGSRYPAGTCIARIETADYRHRVAMAEAAVGEAVSALARARGRHRSARFEWRRYQDDDDLVPVVPPLRPSSSSPSAFEQALATRLPELRAAQARRRRAEAELAQARLQLERTSIRTPFAGVVSAAPVERGSVISAGQRIIELIGRDHYQVLARVPVARLPEVALPTSEEPDDGASATIEHRLGRWQGRVIRLLPGLQPAGRLAQLLIQIDAPGEGGGAGGLPLLIDSWVAVTIAGGEPEELVAVPAAAVDAQGRVAVYGADDQLRLAQPTIAWRDEEGQRVYVRDGIRADDMVIVSPLGERIDGLPLRRAGDVATSDEEASGD